jgi:hypothetical protein
MNKITFENGTIVNEDFLSEIQKGSSFDGDSQRADFFSEPTTSETGAWDIRQRDSIKDWEISRPQVEPETGIGRLAHDGVVLGYDLTAEVVTQGPPALKPVPGGYGVTVEAGTIILSDGTKASWARQTVELVSGLQENYIYVLEENAQTQEVLTLSVGSSLPSVSVPHVALAKLVLNANQDELLVVDGEVAGNGYIDLRPSVHIGNLNTYPRNLKNTSIKSDSYQISVWDRVIADTSNGSIILTLPATAEDSDRIAIADISGTFERYPVILRSPDEEVRINDSVDDWIVNIRDAHLELFYHEATNSWRFEASPGDECTPVLGTFLSCGGKEFIGERLPNECPDGQIVPPVYPNPAQAVYQYEPGSGKCYKQYYDSVAIYADGQGGLITVPSTPRCDRTGTLSSSPVRNIIYVDPTVGDDSLSNTGFAQDRPFRTIERALIEAARESHRTGAYNDRYDRMVIELAPGDYYVDNSPGVSSTPGLTSSAGLVQRVVTPYQILGVTNIDKGVRIQIDSLNAISTQPPNDFNLGRVIYSQSGGVGNITRVEKESLTSSLWTVTLEYVRGKFSLGDTLFYDYLAVVNPSKGGLVVPRGVSIDGTDLRKVRVRPMYIPVLDPVENNPQTDRTSIFKLTGGSYVSLITFTDNPQHSRTHNTVTAIGFASKDELVGLNGEVSYYVKINSLFSELDGWNSDGLEYLSAEYTIVSPVPSDSALKHQDTEENQTGLPGADSRAGSPLAFPGASKIASQDSPNVLKDLPDVNSTRSSSPYVFNCSVRSIFGLNGLWANGALVEGFRSMVTANFTQVSLQTDPNCFTSNTYYDNPPTNSEEVGKRYRSCTTDEFKYRNVGFRCSNDAVIQIVSCFVIGNSDHFVAENGGDLSITNSCSDFGDTSLKAIGYKNKPFSQDEGIPAGPYAGTRLLEVIPPLPLSYDLEVPTLEDAEISTSLVVDYDLTLNYIIDNQGPGGTMPSIYRLYCRNSNSASPFTLSSPPKASSISYNQFSYTKESTVTPGVYELAGGSARPNRKRMYVNGFDEFGNSILYTGNIRLPENTSPGWENLDDRSKIFVWDAVEELWYVELDSVGIVETTTPGADYLLKKFDYAFRHKLSEPNQYTVLDFFFNGSSIKIIRGLDKRTNDERIYKTVLSGYFKANGVRKPQSFYVLERQVGEAINAGSELSNNPVTVTQIRTYEEYLTPGTTETPTSGKYVTLLTKGSDSRRVFTNNIYPVQDYDEPELTEDPADSITKQCLESIVVRPGVWASAPIEPSTDSISIRTESGADEGIAINLRRPSTIRASNHTWEWTGYLNYDTSLPIYQGDPLDRDFALAKVISESAGGRVYATGMNEEGSYFIGTTVFDLRSGEQFAIPLQSSVNDSPVANQVFSNVIIRSSLLLQDDSSVIFGRRTQIFFSPDTQFKSLTTGEVTASATNPPGVYATKNKAGLVQIAKPEEIRGAFGSTYSGVASQVVVTAKDLADELNVRFGSSVGAGTGIVVTENSVSPPGGGDPITQFVISVSSTYGGFTPLGGIIMWTGYGGDVPTGWALCNTSQTINGIAVPNLSNRFIIGASTGANVTPTTNVTGSATLYGGTKDAVVVSHTHSGTTDGGGAHTHSYDQAQYVNTEGAVAVSPRANQNAPATTSEAPSHTHGFTTGDATDAVSGTDKNLPPYYALAFICRVA